jgi:hypothetical protein
MSQSNDELLALVAQLRAEVNELKERINAQGLASAGRGWSNPVANPIPASTFAAIDRLGMPKSAMVDLVNSVPDDVVRAIGREDRVKADLKSPTGKG